MECGAVERHLEMAQPTKKQRTLKIGTIIEKIETSFKASFITSTKCVKEIQHKVLIRHMPQVFFCFRHRAINFHDKSSS